MIRRRRRYDIPDMSPTVVSQIANTHQHRQRQAQQHAEHDEEVIDAGGPSDEDA